MADGEREGRLNATVYVQHEGDIVGFGPNSEDVPESVARLIGGHAWEGGENPYGDPAAAHDASDGPPPKAGKGSGVQAWQDYAKANGVTVDEDASRDAIIEACTAAGVPVGDDEQ